MTAITRPRSSRMTRDEFVIWDAPTPVRWQLVDGEALEMAPTNGFHGAIQAELALLIGIHLRSTGGSGKVVIAPGVVPRARAEVNFRIPDLAVTFEDVSSASFLEMPRLLVEISSPSNESATRANVWTYATIPSVQEILLLRSSRIEAELLRRGADGQWPADPTVTHGNTDLSLGSIGFTTPLAAIYRTTGLVPTA